MNNNLKQAIKIANKIRKEVELFAYNVNSYTYEEEYHYSKAFDTDFKYFNTYLKNLHGNKEIKAKKTKASILISDQVYLHIKNKYNLYLRQIDSLTSKRYIDSFINSGNEYLLNEKANEIVEKYKLFEINQMHDKLSNMLVEKVEIVSKSVKI